MIEWLILALIGGALVAAFWDNIKEWAIDVFEEVKRIVSNVLYGVLHLVKTGGKILKRLITYFRRNGQTFRRVEEEQISESELPDEAKDELRRQQDLEVMKLTA